MLTDDQVTDLVNRVLGREGAFVDDPADPGGATNWGITGRTLALWRNLTSVTAAQVRAMPRGEAFAIYRHDYVIMPGFVSLPLELADLVIDTGVLHGQDTAGRWLQQALGGLKIDGNVGPKTIAAVAALTPDALRRVFLRICAMRVRDEGRQITAQPKKARFAAGWMQRVSRFIDTAP